MDQISKPGFVMRRQLLLEYPITPPNAIDMTFLAPCNKQEEQFLNSWVSKG
jgi:hypothetical protein